MISSKDELILDGKNDFIYYFSRRYTEVCYPTHN